MIRFRLLMLLWIWALLVFVVIDLFLNVTALDEVRPRAHVYRAMRYAAHKMVGEPYLEGGFGDLLPTVEVHPLQRSLQAVARQKRTELMVQARNAGDARVRIASLEALVANDPSRARSVLRRVLREEKTPKVRRQATRLLGRTGPGAFELLQVVRESADAFDVKAGAIEGLAEVGSRDATVRLVAVASGRDGPLRRVALHAICNVHGVDALAELTNVSIDGARRLDVRVAALGALGRARCRAAAPKIVNVLTAKTAPAHVRAAAAEALGRIGDRSAIAILMALSVKGPAPVATSARIAVARLDHVRED